MRDAQREMAPLGRGAARARAAPPNRVGPAGAGAVTTVSWALGAVLERCRCANEGGGAAAGVGHARRVRAPLRWRLAEVWNTMSSGRPFSAPSTALLVASTCRTPSQWALPDERRTPAFVAGALVRRWSAPSRCCAVAGGSSLLCEWVVEASSVVAAQLAAGRPTDGLWPRCLPRWCASWAAGCCSTRCPPLWLPLPGQLAVWQLPPPTPAHGNEAAGIPIGDSTRAGVGGSPPRRHRVDGIAATLATVEAVPPLGRLAGQPAAAMEICPLPGVQGVCSRHGRPRSVRRRPGCCLSGMPPARPPLYRLGCPRPPRR